MFNKIEILQLAQGLASYSAARQSVVARNIANADTPGYKVQDIAPFEQSYDAQSAAGIRTTRAAHIDGGARLSLSTTALTPVSESSPNGNSVSLEAEMVKASETRYQHDLALAVYSSALGIVRTSIGR